MVTDVVTLQLSRAMLIFARDDLNLVANFILGQRPRGVGFDIADIEAPFVELEFLGSGSEVVYWTCDLSYDYVRINADYCT